MSVEEASGVRKDRVRWRAICRGGKKRREVIYYAAGLPHNWVIAS
jgi:hypothetical protein